MSNRFISIARHVEDLNHCNLCNSVCFSKKYSHFTTNSKNNWDVLFIGESPSFGIDRSVNIILPLTNSKSGRNLYEFIVKSGLNKRRFFVINCVSHIPLKSQVNSRKPTLLEIKNCSDYVKKWISIIDPKLIVTLGHSALASLSYSSGVDYVLSEDVSTLTKYFHWDLFPTYHPSPNCVASKGYIRMYNDYVKINSIIKEKNESKKSRKR